MGKLLSCQAYETTNSLTGSALYWLLHITGTLSRNLALQIWYIIQACSCFLSAQHLSGGVGRGYSKVSFARSGPRCDDDSPFMLFKLCLKLMSAPAF